MAVQEKEGGLQHIYNSIHKVCVVCFFNYATSDEVVVFQQIDKICGLLLAEAVKKQFEVEKKHSCSRKGMFAQAYLAPWPYNDIVAKAGDAEGKYLLTSKDRENGRRLYQALRKANGEKTQEIELSVEEIQAVMEQVLKILEQGEPPEKVRTQVEEALNAYHLHFEKGALL